MVTGPDYQKDDRGHFTKTGQKSWKASRTETTNLSVHFFQRRRQYLNHFSVPHVKNFEIFRHQRQFQCIFGVAGNIFNDFSAAGKFFAILMFRPFSSHC
jgi:hypothetical protein